MELSEEVEDELTCVESILLDTIDIDRNHGDVVKVSLNLGPLTASDDELMYVGLVLALSLGRSYPESPPTIEIQKPRGLSEDQTEFMLNEMKERCVLFSGSPVIFELVNFCQEYLTEQNVPSCPCPICLSSLEPHEEFCKTACYHYYHSFCLGSYYKNLEEAGSQIPCPVCRENISSMNFTKLCLAKEPQLAQDHDQDRFAEMAKKSQRSLQALYQKQLRSGSIIDTEADKNRRLITITGPPETPGPSVPEPPPEAQAAPAPLPPKTEGPKPKKSSHHRRPRGRNNNRKHKHQPDS